MGAAPSQPPLCPQSRGQAPSPKGLWAGPEHRVGPRQVAQGCGGLPPRRGPLLRVRLLSQGLNQPEP